MRKVDGGHGVDIGGHEDGLVAVLSWLWWVLVVVVQGALSLLLLLVLSLISRVEPSLGWRVLPPRSYMNLQSSLVLKSLGLPGWLLRLRMLLWLLLLLSRVVLRSKGLKVRRAQVVLRRKWSQGTGTLSDVGSALRSLPKTNVLG